MKFGWIDLLFALLFFCKCLPTVCQDNLNENIPGASDKIAFLFLTRGPMPLELIWEEFFEWSGHPEHYSIYIHPHENFAYTEDSIFHGKEVRTKGPTVWGALSVSEAIQALVRKAVEDPLNKWFVLMSESCIPLHPLSVWRSSLFESTKSIINACPQSDGASEVDARWGPHLKEVGFERKYWRKSATWFALNRRHATIFAEDNKLLKGFEGVIIPDEHFVASLLAMYGLDNETTCNDGFMHHFFTPTGTHPASYGPESINMDLFAYINRAQGGRGFGLECSGRKNVCHFTARKFPGHSLMKLIAFLDVILNDDERPYVGRASPLERRLRVVYNTETSTSKYYLLMHGSLYFIPSVHAVEAFHLNASTAVTISTGDLGKYPLVNNYFKDITDGILCKSKHNTQVYFIFQYRKYGIDSWGILETLKLAGNTIIVMHDQEVAMIPDGEMIDNHNVDQWKSKIDAFFGRLK